MFVHGCYLVAFISSLSAFKFLAQNDCFEMQLACDWK